VNAREPSVEKSGPSRVSKSAVVVMLIIIGTLALLAVFANMQRFGRGQVETVVARPATTPAPQAR
jgi:flagellar basal body-associated protein FliL